MQKLIYLTKNPHKVAEANLFFKEKYGFNLEILSPEFEVIEIQANTCAEVVAYSVKYAAERLQTSVLKSDSGLYIDCLGGLPGPYNAYFDKQIGVKNFLGMLKDVKNRRARLEHAFGYCEPNNEPVIFSGGSYGTISYDARGEVGRWHDLFFIPDGETKTLSELRAEDHFYEAKFWGSAINDFAEWYLKNVLKK
jgi:XTP/dITP diphosphohydrolase